MSDTTYDSRRDTPHPMVEAWALEWASAFYLGPECAWVERIELARLALRERARASALETEIARLRDVARAAERVERDWRCEGINVLIPNNALYQLRDALEAARSSGARGGWE